MTHYTDSQTYFSVTPDTTGAEVVASDPTRRGACYLQNEDGAIAILVSGSASGPFITVNFGDNLTILGTGAVYIKSASGTPTVTGWYV